MAVTLKKYFPIILLLTALLLFCCPVFAAAAETSAGPVNIEADSMDHDVERDTYHAQGGVVITYSGGILYADDVTLDRKSNLATALGNVLIKSGDDTLQGDKIIFNIETKTGTAYQGKAFLARNHFYIRGDKIEKTGEQTYEIEKPVATTCDGETKDWEIAGNEMKVTIEGYGLMKGAKFRAGNIPLLYLPYAPFPAKTKRVSGFIFPYLSYSQDKDGLDIEIPYFWAISPQLDATFYQRYIEKRGFKEGVEFRYYLGRNTVGTIYGDYLEDKKEVTESATGFPNRDWHDTHRRWSLYWNNETTFGNQFNLRADINKVSDNWYFHDFSAHNYYLSNYSLNQNDPFRKISFLGDEALRSLTSTVRLTKSWSAYNVTALVSSTDDFAVTNNDGTLQRYPEITFTGIKQSLFRSPVYYEFTGLYDYFYRGVGQKGHFAELAPSFSLPFNVLRYAKLIPQITFRGAYWSRDDEQATGEYKSGSRGIYNASLSLSTQVSRVFDVNVQSWEKIRHEIKPEIFYSYIPYIKQDNIPDYMPIVYPFVTPITTPTNNILAEQNAVAWALTNTFTAKIKNKAGVYGYLEFLRIKLFQTYDINEAKKEMAAGAAERRPLSDISVEADFLPHSYVSFAARNKYSLYTGWKETNYDLSLSDWRGDRVTVGYRYTLDAIEEININAKAVITSKLDAIFISRRDQFNSRMVENTLGMVYHTQCWAVGLDITRSDSVGINNTNTTDTRFVFKFSLAGLTKFGF